MAQTPRPVDAGISVGQEFLGKYRVESILGHGGMGVVAKCIHLGLGEMFAIKMLRQDVLLDRDAVERFTREAQSASKLKSEHVARVIDVGNEDGIPYMVMEFLDGQDLGQMVDERGSIQAPFASMLMLQAAEALCEAHTNNIVHRDVKPSNLFVTWRPDGSALVKVLDFGISKSPTGTDMKLTQTQSLLGTPAYMSPEQMRSARLVDMRTDIWSLGTVFYELLEGRRPFEAESFSEMCVKVAVDPPSPMVNAPPALQAIILRCLAKNPDQRYANMAELARDLLPHVQDVHQATLLVDRMQRMLGRRSAAAADQWEAATGASRVPGVVRDHASAPVVAPWAAPGASDPFAAPSPTPAPWGETNAPTATVKEESRPARAASEVITKPKKSRLPFVLLGLAALGAVIGVVIGLKVVGNDEDKGVSVRQNDADVALKSDPPKLAITDPKPDNAGTAQIKTDEPVTPAKDPAAEAMVIKFEEMAKLLADKPTCDRFDKEAEHRWGAGGYAAAVEALAALDVDKRKAIHDTYGERLDPATKAVSEMNKNCEDAKRRQAQIAAQQKIRNNAGNVVRNPPPLKCAAGTHKVGSECVKDEAKPVVDVPKPTNRSPNGKCGVLDRNPSNGSWPDRCVK